MLLTSSYAIVIRPLDSHEVYTPRVLGDASRHKLFKRHPHRLVGEASVYTEFYSENLCQLFPSSEFISILIQ